MYFRVTAFSTAMLAAGMASCAGNSGSGASYEEYECPAPVGRIVREDCSRQALKYEGATFGGSIGVGPVEAGANYRDLAIREADSLVQLLKEQRVGLCNDFNTCKLSVPEYRAEVGRIDDSFVALLALKDRMAELDAEGASKLLKEIRMIRLEHRGQSGSGATMSCEGTTIDVATKQYCLFRQRKTFHDARRDCERQGGHLAVIESEAENKAIYDRIGSPWGYGGGFWLGCTDRDKEGEWRCGDAPLGYTNWADGQPNNYGGVDDFLQWQSNDGKWNDLPSVGHQRMGYLCEGGEALRCAGRRLEALGRRYCAHKDLLRWDDAQRACMESGGQLATIETAEESQAVFDALKLPSGIPTRWPWEGVWIGFTDEAQEGSWRWLTGTEVRFGMWGAHEPNGGDRENCATMALSWGGPWVDLDCKVQLPYLCEAG